MTPLLAQHLRTDRSFERLYRRHLPDVYHYALAVARNAADAEDITQTTFLNAYRAYQRGEQPRAPKNWLLAIAHNVMRQRFRQSARRPDEVELHDTVAATVPDDEGYSAEDIRRALGELAFNQRAALVMRELEGRSYAEIAEILGIGVGAVETLIFRARRALREQLEGSLTCHEAELAISRQLDGRLSRAEKATLRAHLRSCQECASFARSQRAQRAALRGLALIPVPTSLTSLFGGGAGVALGGAVATKAAAFTAVGLLVAGGSIETAKQVRKRGAPDAPPAAAAAPGAGRAADVEAPGALPPASTIDVAGRPRAAVPPAKPKPKPAERAQPAPGSAAAAVPGKVPPGQLVAAERSRAGGEGRARAPGQTKKTARTAKKPARGRTNGRSRRAAPAPSSARPQVPPGRAKEKTKAIPPAVPPSEKDKSPGPPPKPPGDDDGLSVTVTVPGVGTVSTPEIPKPKKP